VALPHVVDVGQKAVLIWNSFFARSSLAVAGDFPAILSRIVFNAAPEGDYGARRELWPLSSSRSPSATKSPPLKGEKNAWFAVPDGKSDSGALSHTTVVGLLLRCRPAAISRLVIAIVVDAVER
jgi:hypothetical protein